MNQVEFSEWPVAKSPSSSQGLKLGIVRLNNPRALNSLTLSMVEDCCKKLLIWERDPSIAAVLFYSDLEKAFCAGGDVKTVVQNLNAGDPEKYSAKFFRWEYKMDYTLQTYQKPVITWGDGIVMGGGMGIFCASSHRVVTERTVLAMPEINIGFFPDVGAGVFLNRLSTPVALFLAWTAARVNPVDALKLGFATHILEPRSRTQVFSRLRDLPWTGARDHDEALISKLFSENSVKPQIASELESAQSELNSFFDSTSDPKRLTQEFAKASFQSKWIQIGQANFKTGSPTSALVSFEQLKRSKNLSVLDVFVMEWNIARQMCERKDFREGVRSRLIDKDNSPRWQPPTLAEVSDSLVLEHFAPFAMDGESQTSIREFFDKRQSWT